MRSGADLDLYFVVCINVPHELLSNYNIKFGGGT